MDELGLRTTGFLGWVSVMPDMKCARQILRKRGLQSELSFGEKTASWLFFAHADSIHKTDAWRVWGLGLQRSSQRRGAGIREASKFRLGLAGQEGRWDIQAAVQPQRDTRTAGAPVEGRAGAFHWKAIGLQARLKVTGAARLAGC